MILFIYKQCKMFRSSPCFHCRPAVDTAPFSPKNTPRLLSRRLSVCVSWDPRYTAARGAQRRTTVLTMC